MNSAFSEMDPIKVENDYENGPSLSFNSSDVLAMYGLDDSLTSSASGSEVLVEVVESQDLVHGHAQEDQDDDIEVIDENGNVEGIGGCDEIYIKKGAMTLSQMELETSSEFDMDMDIIPTELDQEIAAIEGLEVLSTITLPDGWPSNEQTGDLKENDASVAAEESHSMDSIEIINDPYQDMIEDGIIQSMKTMAEGVDLLCDIVDHEQRKLDLDLDLETDDSNSNSTLDFDQLDEIKQDDITAAAGGDHVPENTTTTMAISDNNLLRQLHLEDQKPFFDRIKLPFAQLHQSQRPKVTYAQFTIFALITVLAILPIILTIGTMIKGGSDANEAFNGIKKSFDIETKMRKIELMMEVMTQRNLKDDEISMDKISEYVKLFEDHRKVTESLYREMSYGDISDDLKLKIVETLKFNTDTIFNFDRIIDGKIQERIRILQDRVVQYSDDVAELLAQNYLLNRKLNEHKDNLNALINGDDRLCNVISTKCALAVIYHAPKNGIIQLATIIYEKISGFFQAACECFWGKKKN